MTKQLQKIDLTGTHWTFEYDGKQLSASVPGCIHTDLLKHELIKDPFYRKQELDAQWISERNWVYTLTFDLDEEILLRDCVQLLFEGLDTFADVELNGKHLGRVENMHRTWEWDVKNALKAGENVLIVKFEATLPYTRAKQQERYLPAWNDDQENPRGVQWIRKEPCNYGWDWGPILITCGIWRPVKILAYDQARLDYPYVETKKVDGDEWHVKVSPRVSDQVNGLQTRVKFSGHSFEQTLKAQAGEEVIFSIKDPKLWWPNGLGDPDLYDLKIELVNGDGDVLDTIQKRIGIRELVLDTSEDEFGSAFQFIINGHKFFAKGANWIPADPFQNRVTDEIREELLQSAVDANMNMLRVWGGGLYEEDHFYERCDELGLCVWQDFLFACAGYPTFEKEFMDNVAQEARDNIRSLQHHASLCLWCGNNELEQGLVGDEWTRDTMSWSDYKPLFDEMLPKIVNEEDPLRQYIPSSAYTPGENRIDSNDPDRGDAHLWEVWHGRKPFEWYRTTNHRFVSEFGFQSFPVPETIKTFAESEDLAINSAVMEHHQRSPIGNEAIMTYALQWFAPPKDWDATLWLSQILQALAIKYACEHWRRSMPRTMGAIYWQLNDCWPVASWASIDYHRRWKALHYAAKKFFAPLLGSLFEDPKNNTIEVHLTNDRLHDIDADVELVVTNLKGEILDKWSYQQTIQAGTNRCVHTYDANVLVEKHGQENLLIHSIVKAKGEQVSENLAHFVKPKHMRLLDPKLEPVEVKQIDELHWEVTLKANDAVSLFTWLELKDHAIHASDQFYTLILGRKKTVTIKTETEISSQEFMSKLMLRNLADTAMPLS